MTQLKLKLDDAPVRVAKLMIPDVGDTFVLAEPWKFTIYDEYRNYDVLLALKLRVSDDDDRWGRYHNSERTWQVTLPAETKLRVDRVYIRKGMADYSSLSFYVEECPLAELTPAKNGGGFKRGRRRFWAKLSDVRNITTKEASFT